MAREAAPKQPRRQAGFAFPTAGLLRAWLQTDQPLDLDAVARRISRRGRLFLLSALLPVLAALILTGLLVWLGPELSDAQYGTALLLIAATVFLGLLQWRAISLQIWPTAALDYYASTVLNRLRGRVSPAPEDLKYLAVVLPDLERILVSGALARRLAGTSVARARHALHHQLLARGLGEAEAALHQLPNAAATRLLRKQAAELLLGTWASLPPHTAMQTTAKQATATAKQSFLARTANSLLDKSAESAISGVVAAFGVIIGGIAAR